jgi:hypothetical protein
MKNLYNSFKGQVLLQKTQEVPKHVWSIVVCKRCGVRYDMRLVNWTNGEPNCPVCDKIQE